MDDNDFRRIEDIRAWRDQTSVMFSAPFEDDDSAQLINVKAWWRDVDVLLRYIDGEIKFTPIIRGETEERISGVPFPDWNPFHWWRNRKRKK